MALRDIQAGEVVVSVPRSIMITDASVNDSALGQAIETYENTTKITISIDDRIALALLNERRLGATSRWQHFVPVLPTSYTNGLNLSSDEIARLKGSNLHILAAHVQAQMLQDYEHVLLPLFARYSSCRVIDPSLRSSIDEYAMMEALQDREQQTCK